MYGQPVTLNQHHIDPEKDKPRNRNMVQMRVRNRSTLALQVLENTIGPGEHVITVYEDQVDRVKALVEPTPHRIKEAELQYELELAEAVKGRIDMFPGTAHDMLALIKAGTDERVMTEYRKQLETTPLSPQGVFRRVNKRDILPLDAAEVLDGTERPEPQRAVQDREAKKLAEANRALVREVVAELGGRSAAAAPTGDDMKALIRAEAEKIVKEMLGEKAAAKR